MLNVRPVQPSADLTARATIRNQALRLFAERGPDAVTVRQIAAAARVSPALVLHHFGSKDGLREAVDTYAAHTFDALLDADSVPAVADLLREGGGASIAEAIGRGLPSDSPLPAYLRRLLLSGDAAGSELFRRWHAATARLVRAMADEGLAARTGDAELRAAVLLANDLSMLLLRDLVASVIGIDPLTPEGLARWGNAVTDLYAGRLWNSSPGAPAKPAVRTRAAPKGRKK